MSKMSYYRIKNGLSLEEMALSAKTDVETIRRLELGIQQHVSVGLIKNISAVLGQPISKIFLS